MADDYRMLGDVVTMDVNVFESPMQDVRSDHVAKSLSFRNDGVGVMEVGFIRDGYKPIGPNELAEFIMEFLLAFWIFNKIKTTPCGSETDVLGGRHGDLITHVLLVVSCPATHKSQRIP